MSNILFDDLIQGKYVQLKDTELPQFQIYCSTQNLSLEKWNDISLNLFRQKREYSIHFLQYVQKNELSKPIYNDFIHQDNKMRIYNNLFALYLTKATKQRKILCECILENKPQGDLSQAIRYLTEGENVKVTQNILSRAFLDYFDGELTKATNMFNTSIRNSQMGNTNTQDKFIAMIGLAQVSFLKKNYAKALQLYRSVLSTFKSLPVKARIGMAYCYFYLQKYEMAKACFVRILKLKEDCIEAYIGLAAIQAKNQNFGEYFKYMSKAVKINRKHPLVLIHLSEHYLIKGDLQKATKLAQQGLQQVEKMAKFFVKPNKTMQQSIRNDYLELKARFNNILGQVQHIKNNFLDALKYYRLASNQGLGFNEVYLSQVYTHPICQNYVEGLQILQKLFKQSPTGNIKFYNESLKDLAYLKSKNPSMTAQQKTCEDYYSNAISYNKNDIEVKIELSNQITQTKKSKSLKLLLNVYKTLQSEGIESIKPQLMNNIGVLFLENHEYQQAANYLQKCVERLNVLDQRITDQKNQRLVDIGENGHNLASEDPFQQQSIKIKANYLIALFNLSVAKEKLCLFVQATEIYKKIIESNKYFIDAHIRLSYVYFMQGNFKKSIQVLELALKESQDNHAKFIRFDKVMSMKLAILKMWGDQVTAKDLARQITKTTRDVYTQIYELSLQYEHLMKRQPELVVIKDFLRPNREIYMRLCHDDPNNAFGYLVLCILLLTDKRISLKQGSQLFAQLKQHSSDEIPIIFYNMGLFFMNYDDYEKSKFILKLYKEKTNDEKGEQLCALSDVLQGNYSSSIQSIKKNILMNPTNIKYRYQLFYATEKKVQQQRLDDKARLRSLIPTHLETLKKCHKFYNFFSKFNPNEYCKYFDAPDLKQQTRSYGQKIRTLCDERKFYVGSNIDYYEKLQKDELIKQKEQEERQKRVKLSSQFELNGGTKVQPQITEDNHFDESDSEEIKRRKREEKKRKALELARKKDQEINEKLEEIKQIQREEKEKKLARSNKEPKDKGTRKREKKVKAVESQQEVQYESDKSFIDQPSHESPSEASYEQMNDEIEAPKRKRREQRREEKRERRKKIKKERMNVRLSDEEDDGINPFEDTPQESKKSRKEEQSEQEEFERKKKTKEEKQEEEDMDLEKYLIG